MDDQSPVDAGPDDSAPPAHSAATSGADPDPGGRTPPAPGTLPRAVPTRARHDGWTPERQHDFIAALAASGCVTEAAATVGIDPRSAYRLRARPDAGIFRQAWDVALDFAIRNLSEAAIGRALHGVARPIFYQGEQIGERRYYDERLTQFLLRYRDPVRYGAWRDGYEARRHPDGAGIVLANALNVLLDAAHGIDPPVDRNGVGWPLEEGPMPESADTFDYAAAFPGEDAELLDLRRVLRESRYPGIDPDSEEADWRDPDLALRPRRARNDGPRIP